jgi:hypothetical protein
VFQGSRLLLAFFVLLFRLFFLFCRLFAAIAAVAGDVGSLLFVEDID